MKTLVKMSLMLLNGPPDGASVHACAITIYYSSGVGKIPRQDRKVGRNRMPYRWRKRPRLCCLIKTLRILPINVGRTDVQNSLDFVTALLVDRHKRGRLRHRGEDHEDALR